MAITATPHSKFIFRGQSLARANTADLTVGTADVGSKGNLVYDEDTAQLKFYDGSNWHQVVSEQHTSATGAGNGETLDTTNSVSFYDPGGASRTGVILEAGARTGQRVTIVNTANAAEDITFATAGTSNVSGGTSVVISQHEATTFVWENTLALWFAGNLT